MFRKIIVLVLGALMFGVSVFGQEANVAVDKEVEAFRCWLKSDRSGVRIGEKFYIALTCRVIENESTKTVPVENMLEPGAVSFAPYEVAGGTHFQDIRKGVFRFFQYNYELRLVGDEFFGKEVPIPSLEIKYKIQRKINSKQSVDARERVYKLPELPIKIYSLVPKDAKDIRDAGENSFGAIKTKMLHAYAAFVVAGLFMLLPFVIVMVPLAKSLRRYRREKSNGTVFSNASLLRRAKRELVRVKKISIQNGWNNELAGRVLTILRVVGAIALSRQINQQSTQFESKGLQGQLKLRKGFFWPKKILISSSLTPELMMAELEKLDRSWADGFVSIFNTFNGARYSDEVSIDQDKLNSAFSGTNPLIRSLRFTNNLFVRRFAAFYGKTKTWRPVWKRS